MARIFQLPKQVPIVGGAVSPGAKANFYLTGTTTPTNIYTDSALTTPSSNPVVADAAGVFATIYLDPDIVYKLTLNDSVDALIYTEDPIQDALTQANIGLIFYPKLSPQEDGLTIVNYFKNYGEVLRYGTNTTPGTTNMTTAVQAALTANIKRVFSDSTGAMLVTTELTSSIADRVIDGLNLTTDGTILAADYVLVSSGARTKIIDNIFDGVSATTVCSAIFVSGVKTEVNSNIFTDFDNGFGIAINSAATGSIITRNQLDDCAPVSAGTQFGSINCNADNCSISENNITDCGQTGISLNGPDYVSITNNYIEGKTTGTTSGGIILDGTGVTLVCTTVN